VSSFVGWHLIHGPILLPQSVRGAEIKSRDLEEKPECPQQKEVLKGDSTNPQDFSVVRIKADCTIEHLTPVASKPYADLYESEITGHRLLKLDSLVSALRVGGGSA
jgi:hypothetical protein